MIHEEKNRLFIDSNLERFFGRKLTISIGDSSREASGPDTPQQSPNGADPAADLAPTSHEEHSSRISAPNPEIERLVAEQPVIKKLLTEFDGEIIPNELYERRSG